MYEINHHLPRTTKHLHFGFPQFTRKIGCGKCIFPANVGPGFCCQWRVVPYKLPEPRGASPWFLTPWNSLYWLKICMWRGWLWRVRSSCSKICRFDATHRKCLSSSSLCDAWRFNYHDWGTWGLPAPKGISSCSKTSGWFQWVPMWFLLTVSFELLYGKCFDTGIL